MPICNHCGVEVEPSSGPCPLCKNPITDDGSKTPEFVYPMQETAKLTHKERVRLFWELTTILHFSALVVTLLIDLITNKKPTWSLIAITSITASYIYITLVCFTVKKLWIFLPGLLVNTLGFLLLIDLYHDGIEWFVNPGLPLAGFFILLLGLVMIYASKTRQRGFNIIAAASLAVGVYCVLTQTFIEMVDSEPIHLSWSVIVAASILPFSLLLFFFQYRLKRGTSLKKFFHL